MSENIYKSLGRNTVIFAFGTLGSKAISILMLPLFTRVMTDAEFGKVDLLSTSISLLLPLFTLNIAESVFRFALDKPSASDTKTFFSSAFIINFLGFVVLILLSPLLHNTIPTPLLFFFYSIFLLQSFNKLFRVFIRGLKKITLFAVSDIVNTVVFAATGIWLVGYVKLGITGYFVSQIVALSVSTAIVFALGEIWKYLEVHSISTQKMRLMVKYSLPLVPNALAWWIISASDRYLLALFIGFEATGIYAVAHRFPLLLGIFSDVFYQAWQITSIEQYDNKDRNAVYSNVFKYLYTSLFLILTMISFFLKPLIEWFVGEGFAGAWKYSSFLMIAIVFQAFSSFTGVGYLAAKRTKGALTSTLISSSLNITLNLVLIPAFGMQGAAISTLVALMTMWLIRLYQTRSFFHLSINWFSFIGTFFMASISILSNLIFYRPLPIQAIAFGSVLLLQRKQIAIIVMILKRKVVKYIFRNSI